MNSWDKSDSKFFDDGEGHICGIGGKHRGTDPLLLIDVGDNDFNLMERLIKGGTEHRKFLRMITVTVDITAPLYFWKEFDTYKVGTVANSCSTMHKIHAKEITLDDFSYEHLDAFSVAHLETFILYLNSMRDLFLETKNKHYWWQMIQLLPSSYNQKRTVQLNYEVLLSQYNQRKGHKLDEWREYCEWVENLPYMKDFLEVLR